MLRVIFLLGLGAVTSTVGHAEIQEPGAGKWKLIWADEFDRNGLPDPRKWGYDVGGHGWGNQEIQYYSEKRPENARVENGRLIIEARREPFQGKEYTSARLVTKGKGDWTYGRIEVRAKRLLAGQRRDRHHGACRLRSRCGRSVRTSMERGC